MRRLSLALVVAVGLLAAFSGCRHREVREYTIKQFMNTRSIYGAGFSHDEQNILFTSDQSGVFNAYVVPVAGGEPRELTHSNRSATIALSFFPHDDRILYSSDEGGNEIYHIFLLEEDGTARDLTPAQGTYAVFYGWSRDGKSFYFGWNRRDARFLDVYTMETGTFEPEMIYQNNEGYVFDAFSNDDRYLAFHKAVSMNNSEMFLYDRGVSKLQHLSPHEGDVQFRPVAFSPDSKDLYFLTDGGSEFMYLKRSDIQSGRQERVDEADWDILYAYFSFNGKYRVVGINKDGRTEIKICENESGDEVDLPEFPRADITSVTLANSEKRMAFYVSGSRSPNTLCVYDFDKEKYWKLVETMSPEVKPDDWVDGRVVRFESFDGLKIPAILYRPYEAGRGASAPAVVAVHGGPGGQARLGYSALIQYLVNHGYVVLDVNYRGSSGYGKTFSKLDDLKHGEDDLADCVAAKAYLGSLGVVDPERIGIMGSGYGGTMVLAAFAFKPEAFSAGVDMFGVSNWKRLLESLPPEWEASREALFKEMGNPQTQGDRLMRISPLFQVGRLSKPLLVFQGGNDPQALKSESDAVVAALKKKGVPVDYVLFEGEGHGFSKKNRIQGYEEVLKFLDRYLKRAPQAK